MILIKIKSEICYNIIVKYKLNFKSMGRIIKLVTSILTPLLVGVIGSIFTSAAIPTWYNYLNKPTWNPPSWLFGPVWTTLYILMGVSLFIIWDKGINVKGGKKALAIFSLQLILNAGWSVIFFGARNPFWSLVEIVLLGATIFWTILVFRRISSLAGYLLIPYLAWVIFATYLNYTILVLNL